MFEKISKVHPAKIEKNSSFYAAERSRNNLTYSEKAIYKISALAGVNTIF
ncbi:HaeIII family restriction endonuclease [Enterococcus cecorum]